jgi:SAM-dependent methyltransferase
MRIDLANVQHDFLRAQEGRKSSHTPMQRTRPSLLQYDYLALSTLSADVRALIGELPAEGRKALDLGADKSPYRSELERRGLSVETLDVTLEWGADHAGTVEATGLPDASFDVVLCTQVLEHCDDPFQGVREIHRILAPGGHAIVTAPHLWFYHPHPKDHWRFTQEGLVRLCTEAGLRPRILLGQGGSLLAAAQVINFLLYGVLGKIGAPLYAAISLAGSALDRAVPNPLFCHNFACLAQKP